MHVPRRRKRYPIEGLRRSLVAVAFTVLVLGGLAAGGGVSYAAHLVSDSVVAVKAHVVKLNATHPPTVRRFSAAISQYGGSPPPLVACNTTCRGIKARIQNLKKSVAQIAKSYEEIVASTKSIEKKVKSQSTKNQVDALLRKAAAEAANETALVKRANALVKVADGQLGAEAVKTLEKAQADLVKARTDIAVARQDAAEARVIAPIAVATGG